VRAGASLEQRIGAPLPIEELLPLAIRLAGELAELHGRGAIHGDVRPATIRFDAATGEVRLGAGAGAGRSATAFAAGSLPYISPEQTGHMNRPLDSRSDLYSLGVVLYQLLAGRLPFEAEDAVGWVHGHVARQPRPLEQVRPSAPRPLADIIARLLAKLPDDRYQSASGLHHDLSRCLREWSAGRAIAAFPLGERDVSEELRIPQRLYGRDAEAAVMREAFERAAESGAPELVLLSGYSGVGKSTVVRELLRPIVRRRGRFIGGKFEQYKRDIPYFTISQALRALALDLLAEGEPALGGWRRQLAQALGPYAKLIVDLVPQLGLLVGPAPAVPELPLTEAEARLRLVFGRLFAACASAEHPLVMFIDDMQWADGGSLRLVADLMADGEPRHLLIVGAYRDAEVDPSHPLWRALEPVRRRGARISDLVLGPLPEADIGQLVADTVHATPAEAAPLAALVREKTGGNPFFAIQFLTALYHKRSIWFDREAGRWRWDAARIRDEGYTDNVAELMRDRLYALPEATQAALQLAACIGGTVDAATLAIASERDLAPALHPAIEQHLVLELASGDRRTYRFAHDRVHEAAYALSPAPERARVHLEIGRRLLASTPPEALAPRVFEIVNQLERGAALLETREERERLAELDLAAGARALASTAFASALRYFAAGAALLDGESRARRPELAFTLELRRAECELLTGALDAARQRLDGLVDRAATIVDLAGVTSAQIMLHALYDHSEPAALAMLGFARRAGIAWSAHPTDDEVQREYDQIWQALGARPIEALLDLPPMTDPDRRATMDVLVLSLWAARIVDAKLYSLVICRLVNLSLEHGNSDPSCVGYVGLGTILGPRFGNRDAAYRFGRVGIDLVEQRGLLRFKARIYLDFAGMIAPWSVHLRTGAELAQRAIDAANEAGDVVYAGYGGNCVVTLHVAAGEPLGALLREAEAALAFVQKTKLESMIGAVVIQRQLIRSLRGLTKALGSLDDEELTEVEFERYLADHPHNVIATGSYWLRKLMARCLAGDHAGAVAAAARGGPPVEAMLPFCEYAEYTFYGALACAGHHDGAPEDERPRLCEEVAARHAQLAAWAAHCPDNFSARAALVGAELARIRGEPDRAIQLYEQAVAAARAHGFVQIEALGFETAARLHRARGQRMIADAYVGEAIARYARWGAEGKVQQLRDAHPELEPRTSAPPAAPALRPEQLARLSVIKASQTISSVMDQELLSRTLLRFVLEEGGARRVVLALVQGDELEIVAEHAVDGGAARAEARVPRSLLTYAQRTGEPVLLDAAADAGRFAGDPYFGGARPRSALCLPVRLRGDAVALLYLENELVPGAFTAERLGALELLAAQAAISLENARLLERERARRIDAEAAEHRGLLLAEATALMSQALDGGDVSGMLARLCARSFVDWAVIDLEIGGAMVQVAAAHRDPAREPLLRELAERAPPRPGATTLGWEVPRAGPAGAALEPLVLAEDQIQAGCADPHQAELVRRLGAGSAVVVPLCIRGTAVGALALGSAASGQLGRADLELAVELGRRLTLAIHNARLLDETRRALHLREEFLRIASHELRTPLASLRLSAQALLRAAERGREVPQEFMDRSLRRMVGNSHRLEQLTAELLDVTRIEQGRLVLHLADVALDAVVRQAVEQLEPDLTAAGASVAIHCEAPIYGRWDPARLEQVVAILVTNAAKFGPGKPIAIRLEQLGDTARLAVIDRGIGIDPARRPYVFDRFERAVPSMSYGGLGLGLYLARAIVVAHGGAITVDSELDVGSTFTVTLPRADHAADERLAPAHR